MSLYNFNKDKSDTNLKSVVKYGKDKCFRYFTQLSMMLNERKSSLPVL